MRSRNIIWIVFVCGLIYAAVFFNFIDTDDSMGAGGSAACAIVSAVLFVLMLIGTAIEDISLKRKRRDSRLF